MTHPVCLSAGARQDRYNHSEKGKAARLRYAETAKGKAATKKYRRSAKGLATAARYRETRSLEELRSRAALNDAVRRGLLARPEQCEECGTKCKPDAHHHLGYAWEFRLVVRWYCRRCHYKAEQGEAK